MKKTKRPIKIDGYIKDKVKQMAAKERMFTKDMYEKIFREATKDIILDDQEDK